MILIKPSYKILRFPETPLEDLEEVARTCYKSEDKIGPGTAEKMARALKERHHGAMLEFGGDPCVHFLCDRGVSHELVRHRLCSFAQESTRYCNYSKDKFGNQLTFVIPPWFPEAEEGTYELFGKDAFLLEGQIEPQGKAGTRCFEHSETCFPWIMSLLRTEEDYLELIKEGQSPQQARAVLPNSLKTEICVKANTREWMHIFFQRCANTAHPHMRELMVPLAKEFNERCPVLYEEWA